MSAVVEKQIQMAGYRAKYLEQLAAERGTTENALIEAGLDLLFREQERQTVQEEILREDWKLLRQMEAQGLLPSAGPRIVSIVGTPADPAKLRRIGE